MSVEELKLLQAKIIQRNKKCNIIGSIVICIAIIVFIFLFFKFTHFKIEFPLTISFSLILLTFIMFEIFILVLILSIIKSNINGKDIKTFNRQFKKVFVLKTLQSFFDNVDYKPNGGFNETYVEEIGVIDIGDNFDSTNYISGTYKNIPFQQADIEIQEKNEEKDEDGETEIEYEEIFLGRFMIFDFKKNFKTSLIISSNDFDSLSLPSDKDFLEISTENSEFNTSFNVYGENEQDTFYILTPHLIEKIINIKKKLNCPIMLAFVDGKLHVAINNYEDSFEYNVFMPINEQQVKANIVNDIKLITDLVDDLNLDN